MRIDVPLRFRDISRHPNAPYNKQADNCVHKILGLRVSQAGIKDDQIISTQMLLQLFSSLICIPVRKMAEIRIKVHAPFSKMRWQVNSETGECRDQIRIRPLQPGTNFMCLGYWHVHKLASTAIYWSVP
jgi:hypothetical protein